MKLLVPVLVKRKGISVPSLKNIFPKKKIQDQLLALVEPKSAATSTIKSPKLYNAALYRVRKALCGLVQEET
jgi:hypothetical protein